MSNVILPQQERTEPSRHRPCRHGVKSSLRREPDVPGDLLRAIFGNVTKPFRRTYATPRTGITAEGTRLYRASKKDCDVCELKARCCPNAVARKIPRDLHEDARDVARGHLTR